MPDIVNLTRLHLYEIKPVAAQALGAAKVTPAIGIFGRAGMRAAAAIDCDGIHEFRQGWIRAGGMGANPAFS